MSYMTLKNKLGSKTVLILGIFLIICAFAATNAYAGSCPADGPDCTWDQIFPSGGSYTPQGGGPA